ncbi:MAG: type II secretion system F family protein [Candidatus Liptonbacteria bacterium]|nr:type II secretion system F family protein [Candidatus Liptonbacteria bacterium]
MNKIGKRFLYTILFGHVSDQEKINFTRHLALTIKAGLPLLEALRIMQKQSQSKALRKIIDDLIEGIQNGRFLAQVLENYKHVFSDFFVSIVRIGERSGTLSQNLLYLADELKKAKELKNKIRSAMIYPSVIFLATIGITALLTFSIFPKVLPIFSSLKVELPVTTKILIAVFNFLLAYWWTLLIGLIVAIVAFRASLKIRSVRYFVDSAVFFIPVVSSLIVNIAMSNFTRTMGVLLKSGVRIVEAVNITAYTLDNLVYRKVLLDTAEAVRRGERFVNLISKEKKLFPVILTSLIEIGESTGSLEDNLFYLSEYYAEEVDITVGNLTSLLEPLLLLIMGIMVGFVAISIITPIYQVTSSIHG